MLAPMTIACVPIFCFMTLPHLGRRVLPDRGLIRSAGTPRFLRDAGPGGHKFVTDRR